jgi:hypothetical protein
MKAYCAVDLHAILTSALLGGEWSASQLGRFTSRERAPSTHWIAARLGPEPVWILLWREKFPALDGTGTSDHPGRSAELYRWVLLVYRKYFANSLAIIFSSHAIILILFYIAPLSTSNLQDHPLLAVGDCLFNIFPATVIICMLSPPSTTRGFAMPWWQRPILHGTVSHTYTYIYFLDAS